MVNIHAKLKRIDLCSSGKMFPHRLLQYSLYVCTFKALLSFQEQTLILFLGTPIADYYPPTMHYGLRSCETICRRISQVAEALGLNKKLWLSALKRVARKVDCNDETSIRFSENGIITLFKHFTAILKEAKISGLQYDILNEFGRGLYELYLWLLRTPVELTGAEFDIHARSLLGMQFVQIFGTQSVTATVKQISVYTGYFIDKAKEDGISSGQSLSLRNFSDSLMETAHKTTKSGPICYSGGKNGPANEKEYQESILAQQMANCALHITTTENIPATFSSTKVKRQLKFQEQMRQHSMVKFTDMILCYQQSLTDTRFLIIAILFAHI